MSNKYPDITDNNFQNKIANVFSKYKISDEKISFKSLCFPNQFTYQLPQLFVSKFTHPNTIYKGLLIFHKIGAGKTGSSILIGLQWYKQRKVIYIIPASLVSNLYKEFRSEFTGNLYVSKKEREILQSLHPTSKEYLDLVTEINERIDKDFIILSFHKYINLINSGELNLNNSIVIIDEVQNIVSERGSFYKDILKSLQESPKSTRIIVMSGTPIFDKPVELALTINLLKPTKILPVGKKFNEMFLLEEDNKYSIKNGKLLKEMIKGYISYFPGAPKIAFPKEIIKIVHCEMSNFQYKSYKMVLNREGHPDFKDILKLSNAFYIGSRMISNISFPNKKVGIKGLESLTGKYLDFKNIKKYSVKFDKIIKRIRKIEGPAIVYSNFREFGGIDPFIKMLEYNGYVNVLSESANNKSFDKKRFAIWSGKETMIEKETSKNIYNMPANANGNLLKIMIISPSGKEGLSLFRTRSLHVLEPYWNWSRLAQIFGRGSRFCSHKDLAKDDRTIQIFIYIATSPEKEKTIDVHIWELMLRKKKLLQEFYDVIIDSAVDKQLFANSKKFT